MRLLEAEVLAEGGGRTCWLVSGASWHRWAPVKGLSRALACLAKSKELSGPNRKRKKHACFRLFLGIPELLGPFSLRHRSQAVGYVAASPAELGWGSTVACVAR